ncbi:unnamed protein product [Darwinula stevensoni]|uniref:Major facilitator superfamily (MFS) profile domain-containing protein n=1 Tax=Darwinula stevensoni TaxID=69355 RepID=A0A7R9ABM7_9CRUS|nr:unnamed protein product [Darwinula stevensoni]CAG0899524.1 unnamed protein product [Darwinula stevensoni]
MSCLEDLPFKKKRYISFVITYASNFLGGTEFAIILPSVWKYLQQMGVTDEVYLGLVTSSFSLAALFSGILVGYWADRSRNVRKIALTMNLFQIVGNLLYFIGFSPWVLLLGRFLSGTGVGMNTALYAEVSRSTTSEERTPVLTGIFAMRQISIILAPAYNLALANVNFQLGRIHVTEENSPGLLMAIIYVIFEVVVFFLFFNLSEEYRREEERQRIARETRVAYGSFDPRTSIGEGSEKKPLVKQSSFSSSSDAIEEGEELSKSNPSSPRADAPTMEDETHFNARQLYRKEFLKLPVIVLLLTQMTTFLCQTLVETIIPPTMQTDFGLGNLGNSYLYMAIGGESILVYIIVIFASKRGFQDRSIIICGSVLILYALAHLLVVAYFILQNVPNLLPYFAAGCMMMFLGVPAVSVSTMSLITKLIDRRAQGLGQGIRRTFTFLGIIIGPLWGGLFVFQPLPLYILPLVIVVLYFKLPLTLSWLSSFEKNWEEPHVKKDCSILMCDSSVMGGAIFKTRHLAEA